MKWELVLSVGIIPTSHKSNVISFCNLGSQFIFESSNSTGLFNLIGLISGRCSNTKIERRLLVSVMSNCAFSSLSTTKKFPYSPKAVSTAN